MYRIKYSNGSNMDVDEDTLKKEIERNKLNQPKFIKENGEYVLLEVSEYFANHCSQDKANKLHRAKVALKRTVILFSLLMLITFFGLKFFKLTSLILFLFVWISLIYIGDILINNHFSKMINQKSSPNIELENYIKVEKLLCAPSNLIKKISVLFSVLVVSIFIFDLKEYVNSDHSTAFIRLFLHGSLLHFVGNMIGLIWVIKRLEKLAGLNPTINFIILFITLNALINLYLVPDSIGFSGVILSLFGMLLIVLLQYQSNIHLYDLYFDLFYIAAIGVVGYQFISNKSHVYGFLIGLMTYSLYLYKNPLSPQVPE